MKMTRFIEKVFTNYLPSPFTLAILLTITAFLLTLLFTLPADTNVFHYSLDVLSFWEKGIWSTSLLEFAYQMMLILVLGHVLVLSKPMSNLIENLTKYCTSTPVSAAIVASATMIVAFFNWGLGLIFGALLARKVGEEAQQNNIPLNYPLIGAAGYVGLMVWHSGISGSAPVKINEDGHLKSIMTNTSAPELLNQIPSTITFSDTVFSAWNLITFAVVFIVISILFFYLGRTTNPTKFALDVYQFQSEKEKNTRAEKLDSSRILAILFGSIIVCVAFYQYGSDVFHLKITPNFLNFFMLGLGIVLHGTLKNFANAVGESISDISGILIQFPLYFGIMGMMTQSGMVNLISDAFISISNEVTLPIFTFFSAGLVNIFVPSGGGQWVVQGPIVIESALQLGVPLPKAIMALAYGDQITNMLQPFWALPLLGITKLKAKEILPYTLITMIVASVIYILALILI